jgi:hypothetical protein
VQQARHQDAIVQAFADELAHVLTLLDRHLALLIASVQQTQGRLVRTSVAIGQAIAARSDIRAALRVAGYDTLVSAAMEGPLDRLADQVLAASAVAQTAATRATGTAATAIRAFKDGRLAQLVGVGNELSDRLWRTVLDGVLSVRPPRDLLLDLQDVLDASEAQARTVYDTAVSTFSRQVDQLDTTGQPDELFLYAGPADSKTRPFCRARVGKVFTRAEIDSWDNGQLPNPMLTGGGFNCRHANKVVSMLDRALIDLRAAGGRLPHVAAALTQPASGSEARA